MPVGGVHSSKRPDDARERQAARDVGVLIDIAAIIEIDEFELKGLAEDYPGYRDQKNADAYHYPPIIPTSRPVFGRQQEESAARSGCCHL